MKRLITRKFIARMFIAIFAVGLLVACGSAATQASRAVRGQQDVYLKAQPLHIYNHSNELEIVQQLYDIRTVGNMTTWTVWSSSTGVPIDMCVSKGFGIPYNTSMTSPEDAVTNLPQPEPNGLFPNGSTDATWVACVIDGKIYGQYIEATVNTYTYPVEIVRADNGQPLYIRRSGDPDVNSAITITGGSTNESAPAEATPELGR